MRGCRRRLLAAAALCALAAAAAAGCAAEPEGTLRTHVDDWRDEVIYQIVVDRFDNGDPSNDRLDGVGVIKGDLARYQGGDWRGVINRLGYIERLGASAIWLSPTLRAWQPPARKSRRIQPKPTIIRPKEMSLQ